MLREDGEAYGCNFGGKKTSKFRNHPILERNFRNYGNLVRSDPRPRPSAASVTSRDAGAGKFLLREHNDGMRRYVYADNTVCKCL